MSVDPWNKTATSSGFGRKGKMITPSDTADIDPIPKAITVITAGTLAIIPVGNADADVINYDTVNVGFIPPYLVRRVKVTGTSAEVASIDG